MGRDGGEGAQEDLRVPRRGRQRAGRLHVKLDESLEAALAVDGAAPSGYGLGKAGWVNVPLKGRSPSIGVLRDWVEESYRRIAPKTLVRELDDGGSVPRVTLRPIARWWFGATRWSCWSGWSCSSSSRATGTRASTRTRPARILNTFCYFTVQSNLIVGVTCLMLAVGLGEPVDGVPDVPAHRPRRHHADVPRVPRGAQAAAGPDRAGRVRGLPAAHGVAAALHHRLALVRPAPADDAQRRVVHADLPASRGGRSR